MHASSSNASTPLRFHKKVLYAAVATGVGLLSVELLCRSIVGVSHNARWKYHAQLVHMIGFGELNDILQPHPTRFWQLKPNVDAKRLQGTVGNSSLLTFVVSTDAYGHRRCTTDGLRGSVGKREGEVLDGNAFAGDKERKPVVLCVGDSCTFGVGVDDHETFASLLQSTFPRARSLNAGVPGYSAFQGRVLLDEYQLDPPEITVISFLFNDGSSWDQLSDLEHARAQRSLANRLIRTSRFAFLLAQLKPTWATEHRKTRARLTDSEYEMELRSILDRCRELRSQPILLVWPLRAQMHKMASISKQEVVKRIASVHNVPVVDLVPEFRDNGGARLFADVVHANAEGHELVARLLETPVGTALKKAALR